MSERYNYEYYHCNCGPIAYEESEHWMTFFGAIADRIVKDLQPRTVLDAGCAMGYLVAALRDRGVEAYGVDISEYAISKVREDVKPYCAVGSLTEPLPDSLPKRYDLVVTIEVLEHLYAEEGKKAIRQLCTLSDRIIFSSTPNDFTECTRVNVQQREYWARLFAAEGFFDDLDYRPTYLTAYASSFRRSEDWLRQVEDYERNMRLSDAAYVQVKEAIQASQKARCFTQVLFDMGEGLSEENAQIFEHAYEEDFELRLPIVPGTAGIRVDPAGELVLVTVKKCSAASDAGVFDLSCQANGIPVGNAYMFDTEAPQMWFPNLEKGLTEIRLILNVVRITPDVVENYGRQYYIVKESQELARQYEEAVRQYEETVRQHKKAEQELIKQREKARENLTQHCEEIRRELTQQCEALSQQLSLYQEHYHAAIAQRDQAQYAYGVISNAFFWKVTKPFRWMADGAKMVLRKNRFARLCWKGVKCWKENGLTYTWRKLQDKLHNRQDYSAALNHFTQADLKQQRKDVFPRKIKFSILVPLYNTPENFLREMIQSVLDQTYGNWELCMADGSDAQHTEVEKICRQYVRKDARIQYKKLEKNLGISENTNACIEMASGDYIALLDHDDLLHPAALHEVMKAVCEQDADFVYTDEATFESPNVDKIVTAHFKPDFAPDTLRSYNYIGHFATFSRKLLKRSGGEFRSESNGSQDYDLVLRLTEQVKHVAHVPEILYFWRSHSGSVASDVSVKPYAISAGKKALEEHLERLNLPGEVCDSQIPTIYRIRYEIQGMPLVSIIIPNKDHIEDLQKCISSISEKSTYANWEIIVIENNSIESKTFDYYLDLQKDKRIKVVNWEQGFNYSAISNFGVKFAHGDYILLLNNDVEIITPDWLEQMIMFAQRKDVGAVGCMLYYPDNTVQHAGVILGIGGVACHAHKHFPKGHLGYMCRMTIAQNFTAVTAACMMIRRDVWDEVDGLDEEFKVAFNDVDLCMRIRRAGYLIVWTPYAELYHYESKSRGYDDTPEKQRRFSNEVRCFQERWGVELKAGDPYYNPNLTLDREDFSLK